MISSPIRRKVFISHFKDDRNEVDTFIKEFSTVFIPKVLGANDNYDLIKSSDTNYVMQQIRANYLEDSTVTIVLIGSCTHSRRYVDWELKSSLRQGQFTPNGLLGILLPSQGNSAYLPQRFANNWEDGEGNCYARYRSYPRSNEELSLWIEDAYDARTHRAQLIKNSQEMMKYNSVCKICRVTH
jgi:hypothetical protein